MQQKRGGACLRERDADANQFICLVREAVGSDWIFDCRIDTPKIHVWSSFSSYWGFSERRKVSF